MDYYGCIRMPGFSSRLWVALTWATQSLLQWPQTEFGGIEAGTSRSSGMYCTHNIVPVLSNFWRWETSGSSYVKRTSFGVLKLIRLNREYSFKSNENDFLMIVMSHRICDLGLRVLSVWMRHSSRPPSRTQASVGETYIWLYVNKHLNITCPHAFLVMTRTFTY